MEQTSNNNGGNRLTYNHNTDECLHGGNGRTASPAASAAADQLQLDVYRLVPSSINALLRSPGRQNSLQGQTDLYSCDLATRRARLLLPERGRLRAWEKHVIPLPRTETLHSNRPVEASLICLH